MENGPEKDDFHTKTKHINTLFQFIKSNKEEQFIEYISALTPDDVDVNMKDDQGNYLVFFAVMINNRRILRKLVEFGTRLDILDSEGYSILYYPIKFNYTEIFDMLLEYNNSIIGISLVNIKDSKGLVPISYAIRYRNRHALQELLVNGADANYKGNDNMTALHLAVLKKDATMVRMLIRYIKNIDARTTKGSTALLLACNFQLIEIVKILLENGARQNIMELEYDFYPIFYAVVQNDIELVKLLIKYGANPNHQDYSGNTILHYVIVNNHTELLDYIINSYEIKTKSIDIYDENINSKQDTSNKYIDPNTVNIEGLTITHLMLYNYRENYDAYLNKVIPHTNLNYQDNMGNTPLHIISEKNLWNKFEPLLNLKKLNIYIRNNRGHSVIDMVHLQERENFINTIVKSYYNYLQKHESEWLLNWQNQCSKKGNATEISEQKCFKYIRDAILKEKMSVPIKKQKINITITPQETVQFSTFTGSILDLLVGYKYLTKKYPDATSIYHSNITHTADLNKYNQSLGIEENPNQHIIQFEIRWIYQKIFFPPNFDNIFTTIINARKYKYIIIPISIVLSNGHHSNSLFFDIDNKTLERFEPHGSAYPLNFNYNPDLLDEIIYKKINNLASMIDDKNTKIKYYAPKNYLPKIGFQTLESTEITINKNIGDPNGFCTLWTIWFLDYRLHYNNQNARTIAKNLINNIKINNYSFRNIIRNYSKQITDLRDEYLASTGKNINDYLNNRFTQDDLKKLLIEILSS